MILLLKSLIFIQKTLSHNYEAVCNYKIIFRVICNYEVVCNYGVVYS